MERGSRLCVAVVGTLCSLMLAGSAAVAGAQGGMGTRATAGVFGGVTFPRGDFSDEVATGWNAGGLLKIRAYKALDLRVDGTYMKFGKKDLLGTTTPITTDANIVAGTVNGLLNLGPDSAAYPGDNSVSPYLIAGVGKYKLNYQAECTVGCSPSPDPGVQTYWGLNAGFGATAPLLGLRTFVEGRYHRVSRSLTEGSNRSMFLISAGVKFR